MAPNMLEYELQQLGITNATTENLFRAGFGVFPHVCSCRKAPNQARWMVREPGMKKSLCACPQCYRTYILKKDDSGRFRMQAMFYKPDPDRNEILHNKCIAKLIARRYRRVASTMYFGSF